MARAVIDGIIYAAENGERLSELLIRVGRAIPMPCGGHGDCGKCRVNVNGQAVLACEYEISGDITVVLPQRETVVSGIPAPAAGTAEGPFALALDIGTTTLALALVSLGTNGIVRAVTRTNPQRAFGADVMNRIGWCMEHGVRDLQFSVLGAVEEMLAELDAPEIQTLYVAGNTTMLHLFFGADPSGMGVAPYTPAFLGMKKASGESLGLPKIQSIVSLTGAAAFVGADLTAGLNYIGLPPAGKHRLLIDLGTNAEIVLFSRNGALCTAAAAGPCFEGANISCGMSASSGAVCAYGDWGYRTVNDASAKGICGTGLVDLIAFLLGNGTVDETGFMECGEFEAAPGVTLTQKDIRQYQLAKSAVCSAVETLMLKCGVSYNDIDAVYIAGGFSEKINVNNAVKTGLLPAALKGKCIPAGNSSLLGTVKYICETNDLSVYLDRTRYADLAADPVFSDLFVENMTFGADEI